MRVFVGVLCLALSTFLGTNCHAFGVSILGGGSLSSAVVGLGNGYTAGTSPMGYGGGLLLDFRMLSNLFLETGILYMPRGFLATYGDGSTSQLTFNTIQVPLALRLYVLKSVYVGGGAYFSHGIGNVTVTPTGGTAESLSYSSSYFGADDSGALLSMGIQFSVIKKIHLVFDARYLYSLQNIDKTVGGSTSFRDFQFLGGIKFGI